MASRHILLVGLPGSGKSTVGRLVAQRLGAGFTDLDSLIEERANMTVSRIFAQRGEDGFRALEETVGREVLAGPPGVVAPGGGFLESEALRFLAEACAYSIYLVTSPAEATRRLGGSGGRPLLEGGPTEGRLVELLSRREISYLTASQQVTTDGLTPEQVADRVLELARAEGGW